MNNSQIILIAHGSKDPRWREPFEELYIDLKNTLGEEKVALAYLDFISPSLSDVINLSIKNGIENFKVFPLFMAGGGHVDKDIPKQIAEIKEKFNNISIELLPPIGENKEIVHLMKEIIARTPLTNN
jgi:sirohydrochlorin cobaltochelatase